MGLDRIELCENISAYIVDRDRFIRRTLDAHILKHVLDEDRALGGLAVCGKVSMRTDGFISAEKYLPTVMLTWSLD